MFLSVNPTSKKQRLNVGHIFIWLSFNRPSILILVLISNTFLFVSYCSIQNSIKKPTKRKVYII